MKRLGRKARSALTVDWWLAAIFVGCAVFAAVLVYRAREWSVMTDELLYTEMARGMLETGLPLPSVRGEFVQVYQVLYPLMIAPLIWIVGMPEAYQTIAAANAVALTSACIPAYLLTLYITDDKVLGRWVALCVGVLPWIALATKILTDSLAFPVFVWAVYAIVLAVAEPEKSRRRDWIALAAIALAYLARSQFVVLPAVFCAVILARAFAVGAGERRGFGSSLTAGARTALRAPIERWPVFAATSVVVLLVLLRPEWILGIYSATTGDEFGSVVPSGLLGQMSSHLAMIALGIGVIPLMLSLPWIVAAIGRPSEARQNATALTFAICSLVLLFVAASFDVRFSRTEEVYERYIFYLAPLLLIGAAALFKHPPKRFLGFVLPALAGLLMFARDDHYGLDDSITVSLSHSFKPVAIFEIALQRVVNASGFLPSVTTAMALTATLVTGVVWFKLARGDARSAAHSGFAVIAAFSIWATIFIVPRAVDTQNLSADARFGLRTADQKLWIDLVADGRDVSLIHNSINFADGRPVNVFGGEQPVFWDAEFWNSSVRSFYTPFADRGEINAAMPPYHRLRVRYANGSIELTGGEPASLWLMSSSDPRFAPLPSAPPVHEHFSGLTVYPVPSSPRADWATEGLSYQGFVPTREAAGLRVYGGSANSRSKLSGSGSSDARSQSQSQSAIVRLTLQRKLRASESSRFGIRSRSGGDRVLVRRRSLCLPADGHADVNLSALSSGLIDARHAVRLLEVRVTRTNRGCQS